MIPQRDIKAGSAEDPNRRPFSLLECLGMGTARLDFGFRVVAHTCFHIARPGRSARAANATGAPLLLATVPRLD